MHDITYVSPNALRAAHVAVLAALDHAEDPMDGVEGFYYNHRRNDRLAVAKILSRLGITVDQFNEYLLTQYQWEAAWEAAHSENIEEGERGCPPPSHYLYSDLADLDVRDLPTNDEYARAIGTLLGVLINSTKIHERTFEIGQEAFDAVTEAFAILGRYDFPRWEMRLKNPYEPTSKRLQRWNVYPNG